MEVLRASGHKSFAFKIMTSKPFALRILRNTFCETRAQQDFQTGRGRGVPFKFRGLSHFGPATSSDHTQVFSRRNPQIQSGLE
jgi:hypothetical protein